MQNFRRRFSCKQRRKKSSAKSSNEPIHIDPKHPSTRTFWYYNKISTTEWEEFSDIECEIIENAFNNRKKEIELDSCVINFEHILMGR
jgi:hypothetical protein